MENKIWLDLWNKRVVGQTKAKDFKRQIEELKRLSNNGLDTLH